jgi:hypothetical protein
VQAVGQGGPVMAPRTNLAAVSILAAFVIGSVPAVLAQTTVEAETLYASIGYEETGRGAEAGYDLVFMRKQLID